MVDVDFECPVCGRLVEMSVERTEVEQVDIGEGVMLAISSRLTAESWALHRGCIDELAA